LQGLGLALRRHPWRCLVVLAAVAAGAAIAGPQARAWYHLRQARAALARWHPEDARGHLGVCLRTWPDRGDVRLLAARAAREVGAAEEAEHHVWEARRLLPDTPGIVDLEWALCRAARGDLDAVETDLRRRLRDPEQAPLACEALAEGYLRCYRLLEALYVVDVWLEQQHDSVPALVLRGDILRQLDGRGRAVECYRRALEIEPGRDDVRRGLAVCLLESGQCREARPLWEDLRRKDPGDVEVRVHLARCLRGLAEEAEARRLLEEVVAERPEQALALRTLGEMAQEAGRPEEAERWLREAVRVAPFDVKASWALCLAYRRTGRSAEADKQRARAEELERRRARLGEIGRRDMKERPHDPALLAELGNLLLDLGEKDKGSLWLLRALKEDPDCRAAREGLTRFVRRAE
jgi:tetratricopeptide (TPR) repeat protein